VFVVLAYVASPPTPTRYSSVAEVKAWLAWYGRTKLGAFDEELLQAYRGAGEVLLSFSKEDCVRRSPSWGEAIFKALREGMQLS